MNFSGFDFDDNTRRALEEFLDAKRLPHAILTECQNRELALKCARFLSQYAVCESEEKPCGECKNCVKAQNGSHPDISFIKTKNKSQTYSIETMREIITDSYIKPNDSEHKVYVIEQADERLPVVAQNAFLKLLEEPPKNVHFIMTCESSKKLLPTILSRCSLLRISGKEAIDKAAVESAEKIIEGILSPHEYDLLLALNSLREKERARDIIASVTLILRDAMALQSGGRAMFSSDSAKKIAARYTRGIVLKLIELNENVLIRLKQNININLLTTHLCAEYRRISWQR